MSIAFAVCSAVCLLYFIAIVIYSGIGTSFAFIWLFLSAVFLAGAGGVYYGRLAPGKIPLWISVPAVTLFGTGVLVFLAVEILIFTGITSTPEPGLDYVIVLGAKVKRDGVSRTLTMRLDRAIQYGEDNPDTVFVLSGGKGPDEPMTEARAMKEYMVYNGIREEQIILEERSASTVENIAYSRVAIEEDQARKTQARKTQAKNAQGGNAQSGNGQGGNGQTKEAGGQNGQVQEDTPEEPSLKVGVATSDFHVFRAKQIGKKWGLPNLYGIASPSDVWLLPHYCVRECAAILKDKLMGNM